MYSISSRFKVVNLKEFDAFQSLKQRRKDFLLMSLAFGDKQAASIELPRYRTA